MKKFFIKVRILTVLCAMFGWWGFLYPEFAVTQDTVKIICEETDDDSDLAALQSDTLYWDLLKTNRHNIRFRSKLLMELNAFLEAHSWENLTKN